MDQFLILVEICHHHQIQVQAQMLHHHHHQEIYRVHQMDPLQGIWPVDQTDPLQEWKADQMDLLQAAKVSLAQVHHLRIWPVDQMDLLQEWTWTVMECLHLLQEWKVDQMDLLQEWKVDQKDLLQGIWPVSQDLWTVDQAVPLLIQPLEWHHNRLKVQVKVATMTGQHQWTILQMDLLQEWKVDQIHYLVKADQLEDLLQENPEGHLQGMADLNLVQPHHHQRWVQIKWVQIQWLVKWLKWMQDRQAQCLPLCLKTLQRWTLTLTRQQLAM